jgi:hypothetical protein
LDVEQADRAARPASVAKPRRVRDMGAFRAGVDVLVSRSR